MSKVILVPPNGGYGWVIVFASVLNNFLMVPLIQNVGLIYKPKMMEIGMTISQMLFAINMHASFGQFTGLINSLLLRKFGYRKVTFAGVTFVFLGMCLSSRIPNYIGFLLSFGLIASLGVGLNTSSYTLAIKSYFTEKQNQAIGLSMTLTALGPILMPQIINSLIQKYHPDDVILILAGIISHGYIGALLLQPVKKHLIKKTVESQSEELNKNLATINEENDAETLKPHLDPARPYLLFPPREFISNRRYPGFRRKESVISISYEQETTGIMGIDSTLGGSLYSLESIGQYKSTYQTKTTWWKSEDTVNLESSYNLFDEKPREDGDDDPDEVISLKQNKTQSDKEFQDLPWYKRYFYQTVEMFQLDLLLDLRYINIMLGVSLILFVELNFTVLIPFIFDEYSMTASETANCLSVLGAADIVFRFLAPHIGDSLKLPVRVILILILLITIIGRVTIIFFSSYPSILGIALLMGCVKGVRIVFMSLVIPNYVPKERLAAASAIQIVSNSVANLLGGYLIGVFQAYTGTFVSSIILMNSITSLTILLWITDMLCRKCTKKHSDESTMKTVDKTDIY